MRRLHRMTAVSANDEFARFGGIKRVEVRQKPASNAKKQLEKMLKALGMVKIPKTLEYNHGFESEYRRWLELVQLLDYSPEGVKDFCIAVKEFECQPGFKERFALLLSALINAEVDSNYVVDTTILGNISRLFYRNRKQVEFAGVLEDAAFATGMEAGFIKVVHEAERVWLDRVDGGTIEFGRVRSLSVNIHGSSLVRITEGAEKIRISPTSCQGEIRIEGGGIPRVRIWATNNALDEDSPPEGKRGLKVFYKGELLLDSVKVDVCRRKAIADVAGKDLWIPVKPGNKWIYDSGFSCGNPEFCDLHGKPLDSI